MVPDHVIQRRLASRRCIECERKLGHSEQGALCSECYFAIICDPGLADPVPQMAWRRASPVE